MVSCPGVGAYTGAAMASIAAGEQVAVVDANVMRILARLRCLDWNLKSVKRYSTVAEVLVDPERPGDFNQVGVKTPAINLQEMVKQQGDKQLEPICFAGMWTIRIAAP